MPSLSISFLIFGEDNAYVVLGSIFKESGNSGIVYMEIASIESHCHPTRGSQEGAMDRGTYRKLQVLQAPTPQYRHMGIHSPLLSLVVKVFIVSL